MNDRVIIYMNIIDTITTAMCNFWREFGREPNKILLGKDVLDFILSYNKEMILHYAEPEVKQIMGMDIEVIFDKKGFIEVGYVLHIPYTVNTNYVGGGVNHDR